MNTEPEDVNFATKIGMAIASAGVATMAKISNEILNGRKLSWWGWMAIVVISVFWAVMSGLFCAWQKYDSIPTSIIIGLATLLGEKINIYVSKNYKVIFERILAVFQIRK